jgi:hypothetical protein
MPPALHEANIREFKGKETWRNEPNAIKRACHSLGFRFANRSAASAEASTTLTAVTVGTDQSGSLARSPNTEPTYFGQYFGRCGGLILASGRFDDRQKFTLQ